MSYPGMPVDESEAMRRGLQEAQRVGGQLLEREAQEAAQREAEAWAQVAQQMEFCESQAAAHLRVLPALYAARGEAAAEVQRAVDKFNAFESDIQGAYRLVDDALTPVRSRLDRLSFNRRYASLKAAAGVPAEHDAFPMLPAGLARTICRAIARRIIQSGVIQFNGSRLEL